MAIEPSDEGKIGTLKWVIYEVARKSLLSRGEKVVHTSDVEIKPVGMVCTKKIELGDHFNFFLADNASRTKTADARLSGFALSGSRDDEKTFSWDWFDVDRPGHANKLQESGELSFDTQKTLNGVEIHRMEFLTDVCIRVAGRDNINPLNPTWRIMIFEGSVISWPATDALA